MKSTVWRRLIVALCAITIVALLIAYFTYFREYFTLDMIKEYRDQLLAYVREHYVISVLLYMLSYILLTISSLPVPGIMTVLGGFLFGIVGGVVYGNIAAVIGATIVFWGVRHLLGKPLQEKYAKRFAGFNGEIDKSGASYLLLIQLMGLFPYFMIAFVAGLTHVSTFTFVWTMVVGMLPVSFIYAYAGKKIGTIDQLSDVFTPGFMMAIGAFIMLSIIGIVWKRHQSKKKEKLTQPKKR